MLIRQAEIDAGALSADHLALAKTELRESGFTILKGALDPRRVAEVRDHYLSLFGQMIGAPDGDRIQRSHSGGAHYQLQPSLEGVFQSSDLVANPVAMDCVRAVLGETFRILYFNSNLAAPGSGIQQVHRDNDHLFGTETEFATPAFALVLNLLLCDFTEENGSTEVWPGTHLLTDAHPGLGPADTLDRRAGAMASRRINTPAGTIVIRDVRLWHRGMPNRSEQSREMLSLVYKRSWLKWRYDHSVTASPQVLANWPPEVRRIFSDEHEVEPEPGLPV